MDEGETSVDCGGDCGNVACPPSPCAPGAVYDIVINGSWTEKWPKGWNQPGQCLTWSGSYQRSLSATVVDGAVDVVGWGFHGRYLITDQTVDGFTAEPRYGYGSDFTCGESYPDLDNAGYARLTFTCATGTVAFQAKCTSDAGADGCYPNYIETATGTGTKTLP